MPKVKKMLVPLDENYNPQLNRRKITQQYNERFFKLFCSLFDFQGTVSEEERIVILKQLWECGSFAITRSPAPVKAFEEEMDLVFTKYAIEDFDLYMQPLHFRCTPLKATRAVSKARKEIGKDGVIVYLNEYARLRPMCGAKQTADRYIRQIVNAKMTIQTNILLHKMPFVVPCEEDATDAYKEKQTY